jgi:hypothetical protein
MAAGPLRDRLEFQQRTTSDDGFGNTVTGPFATVFTAAAQLTPLRGGETVMASRLQGMQPLVCRIRSSVASRAVTTAWQVMDRNGVVYQVKSPPADPDGKRAWLEFLIEKGPVA